jgi:hypothetical protein
MEKSTVLESIINEVMCGYFREENDTCKCPACKEYIVATLMKRLSPQFAEMLKDKKAIRVQVVDNQIKADVMREFMSVISSLKNNPQASIGCVNNK